MHARTYTYMYIIIQTHKWQRVNFQNDHSEPANSCVVCIRERRQERGHTPSIAFRHLPPRKDVVNQCLESGVGPGRTCSTSAQCPSLPAPSSLLCPRLPDRVSCPLGRRLRLQSPLPSRAPSLVSVPVIAPSGLSPGWTSRLHSFPSHQ